MTELLLKLLKKETVTEKDITDALYEICDSVHASCDCQCPVYNLMTAAERKGLDCKHHKNGASMAKFILERSSPQAPTNNKKMDSYFAVFNLHVNSADKKAKKDFLKRYGTTGWNKTMAPILNAGVMSIFQSDPTEETQYYVDRVTYYVNENRE